MQKKAKGRPVLLPRLWKTFKELFQCNRENRKADARKWAKASAKVTLFSETANFLRTFFRKNEKNNESKEQRQGKKEIKRKTHIIIYNARERKKGKKDKKNGDEEKMRGDEGENRKRCLEEIC